MSACDAQHPTLSYARCDRNVDRVEDGGDGRHDGDHTYYGDLRTIRWANITPKRGTTDLRVESVLGDAFAKAYGLDREPEHDEEEDDDDDD